MQSWLPNKTVAIDWIKEKEQAIPELLGDPEVFFNSFIDSDYAKQILGSPRLLELIRPHRRISFAKRVMKCNPRQTWPSFSTVFRLSNASARERGLFMWDLYEHYADSPTSVAWQKLEFDFRAQTQWRRLWPHLKDAELVRLLEAAAVAIPTVFFDRHDRSLCSLLKFRLDQPTIDRICEIALVGLERVERGNGEIWFGDLRLPLTEHARSFWSGRVARHNSLELFLLLATMPIADLDLSAFSPEVLMMGLRECREHAQVLCRDQHDTVHVERVLDWYLDGLHCHGYVEAITEIDVDGNGATCQFVQHEGARYFNHNVEVTGSGYLVAFRPSSDSSSTRFYPT